MTEDGATSTSTPRDRTFDRISLYGSHRWCATRLGLSFDRFKRERPALEALGFPKTDPICGLTIKADVDAWVSRRRRYADRDTVEQPKEAVPKIDYSKF
jgi:hypothetical protein